MAKNEDLTPQSSPAMALTQDQFTQLIAALRGPDSQSNAALDVAVAAIQAQAKAQEKYTEEVRARRRSNPNYQEQSVFHFDPRCPACKAKTQHTDDEGREIGLPHPTSTLNHKTFFCHEKARAEELTPIEIELYNSITSDKVAHNGEWTATFKGGGDRRELHVLVPFSGIDAMGNLPPLVQILTELAFGETVADPTMAMMNMVAMQKQIDALQQQLAAK